MFNTVFNRGALPYMEQVLHFTRMRHAAIASNIANADTPAYKVIDAPEEDFKASLKKAVRRQNERHVPIFTFEGTHRVTPKAGGGLDVSFHERESGGFLKHDENNFDIEAEMVAMIKNNGMHNTMATLIRRQFDMLSTAISGRVG